MNVEDCKQGYRTPRFLKVSDINGIRQEFSQNGLVFIEGVDEPSLVSLSRKLGRIVKPRNEVGNGSGVSNIRCAPDLVGKGYSSEELFFHTDRSGWDLPPQLLITTLKTKSITGGESLIVDGYAVRQHIKATDPALFSLLIDRKMTSFRSDDGTFTPRPIFDEITGILRIRYDDGIQFSAALADRLPDLKRIIYQHAYAVSLEPGQSYMADNHRFFHGRTSFTGARELLRVLARPYSTPKFKLVLWDVDGTICRSEALSIDAYYRCISDVVKRNITHENTKVNLHGQTDLSLLRDILQFHGVKEEAQMDEFINKFFELHPHYLEESRRKGLPSTPCPGVREALDWFASLQNQGHPLVLGLLTGNSRANALLKISAAGFDVSSFDLAVSAFGDVHPTRLALVDAARALFAPAYGTQITPRDVLLIGDTPLDVECAKLARCGIVSVATGNYTKRQLEVLSPDVVVDTVLEAKDFISSFIKTA